MHYCYRRGKKNNDKPPAANSTSLFPEQKGYVEWLENPIQCFESSGQRRRKVKDARLRPEDNNNNNNNNNRKHLRYEYNDVTIVGIINKTMRTKVRRKKRNVCCKGNEVHNYDDGVYTA
jgi:hypothetical protein